MIRGGGGGLRGCNRGGRGGGDRSGEIIIIWIERDDNKTGN